MKISAQMGAAIGPRNNAPPLPSHDLDPANKVTNPDAFDNASWTKTNMTVEADAAVAPSGTTTMDRLVPSAVSAPHAVASPVFGIFNNDPLYYSAFVKADGYNRIAMRESTSGGYASFNLANGTVLDTGTAGIPIVSAPTIENAGGGIYKIGFTLAPTGAGGDGLALYVLPDSYTSGQPNDLSWAGDTTSGLFAWRAQVHP